jgi:exosortase
MANAYAAGNLYLLPRFFHEPLNVLGKLLGGDDAHGFFIPLVVLTLFWWKRKELFAIRHEAWGPGLAWIAVALVLHVIGYLVQQPRVSIIALFTGLYGLMGLAWGRSWLRVSFFPFFLLGFAMPMGSFAEPVTFPLRLLVTKIVAFICHHLFAIDVVSEGTRLVKQPWGYEYEVAAACSGIRSLVAITAIAVIYAFMLFRTSWERALLIFSAVPLAVVGNTFRLLAIVFAAEWHGQEGGNKMHESDFGSLLPYVPVIVGLILIGRWLENRAAEKPLTNGDVRQQPTPI